jgi:hypothetical protein
LRTHAECGGDAGRGRPRASEVVHRDPSSAEWTRLAATSTSIARSGKKP